MKNKCVCFINSCRTWGGGEKWHHNMATALNKDGFKVITITNKKSVLSNRLNNKIKNYSLYITNLSFLNPFKIVMLKRILIKEKVSTVIINLPSDLKLIGPIGRLIGLKKIIYRRGSAIPIKNSLLNRFLFKNCLDRIITNSKQTKKMILQKNPTLFDSNKIHVIYNGIDSKEYNLKSDKFLYTKQEDELIIGNIGRFSYQKNHKFLITLAAKLKAKHFKFKLLLAGEGELKKNIQSLSEKLEVMDKIIFLEFQENIENFMNNIDVLVLPSLWEGFGYVIVEAMFFNKPVIAFNNSSNPEIIVDNRTGFLIMKHNYKELINKLEYLKKYPEKRIEMGKLGKKRVKELFMLESTVMEVKNLIE